MALIISAPINVMDLGPPPVLSFNLVSAGTIVPGQQPIVINWQVTGTALSTLKHWGNVVATVSFKGNALYTSEPIAPTEDTFGGPGVVAPVLYSAGELNVNVEILPAAPFAQILYTFGSHELTLTVVGDANPSEYSVTASAELLVVPEVLDPNWFAWTSPGGGFDATVLWNIPYTVAANFTNGSQWTAWKMAYSVSETNLTDNLPPFVRATGMLTTGIGATSQLILAPITQNWSWTTCPVGSLGQQICPWLQLRLAGYSPGQLGK
jgi:hypothetical protein